MSAGPNSDLNPVLAAGNSKVSVISNGTFRASVIVSERFISLLINNPLCLNPPGGRREVPLNQDFFVGFGKTTLEPQEIVVSVFIPFSRKVPSVGLLMVKSKTVK